MWGYLDNGGLASANAHETLDMAEQKTLLMSGVFPA